jgi:hypothetical protein
MHCLQEDNIYKTNIITDRSAGLSYQFNPLQLLDEPHALLTGGKYIQKNIITDRSNGLSYNIPLLSIISNNGRGRYAT